MPKSDLLAPPACAAPMPDGKLTRADVARRLGVSRTTVRRFEGKALHPVEGPGGVRFFEEREVQALQITYRADRSAACATDADDADDAAGHHAADAFERFDHGATPSDVVKALHLRPELVLSLHEAWLRMKQPAKRLSEGELAARAYEMFTAGKSCRDAAIELRQPARVVLAWHRDFVALNEANAMDLPPDVFAKLLRMHLQLPDRHPARALPAAIQKLCEEFTLRIEQLDPNCIEARNTWAESNTCAPSPCAQLTPTRRPSHRP